MGRRGGGHQNHRARLPGRMHGNIQACLYHKAPLLSEPLSQFHQRRAAAFPEKDRRRLKLYNKINCGRAAEVVLSCGAFRGDAAPTPNNDKLYIGKRPFASIRTAIPCTLCCTHTHAHKHRLCCCDEPIRRRKRVWIDACAVRRASSMQHAQRGAWKPMAALACGCTRRIGAGLVGRLVDVEGRW